MGGSGRHARFRRHQGLLGSFTKTLHRTSIDALCHPVEVNEEAQEDLIGSGAVFVDAAEIAEDGYAGHIFAMESQDASGLLT